MSVKYICDICDQQFDTSINDVYIDEHKPNREPLTFNICDDCKEKRLLKSVKRFQTRVTFLLPTEEPKKRKHSK